MTIAIYEQVGWLDISMNYTELVERCKTYELGLSSVLYRGIHGRHGEAVPVHTYRNGRGEYQIGPNAKSRFPSQRGRAADKWHGMSKETTGTTETKYEGHTIKK